MRPSAILLVLSAPRAAWGLFAYGTPESSCPNSTSVCLVSFKWCCATNNHDCDFPTGTSPFEADNQTALVSLEKDFMITWAQADSSSPLSINWTIAGTEIWSDSSVPPTPPAYLFNAMRMITSRTNPSLSELEALELAVNFSLRSTLTISQTLVGGGENDTTEGGGNVVAAASATSAPFIISIAAPLTSQIIGTFPDLAEPDGPVWSALNTTKKAFLIFISVLLGLCVVSFLLVGTFIYHRRQKKAREEVLQKSRSMENRLEGWVREWRDQNGSGSGHGLRPEIRHLHLEEHRRDEIGDEMQIQREMEEGRGLGGVDGNPEPHHARQRDSDFADSVRTGWTDMQRD
ncbi:hypothetical protein MKZ38_003872 [Zalerion maritima]|uniref:Uncharacterized protein n=1 Tax=Zalerion maritima TaxID=339359 RepID=A0AAD5RMX0_9PEZI|nr:hypothetical protein MKZ38_003872 [Zalerion maritima]